MFLLLALLSTLSYAADFCQTNPDGGKTEMTISGCTLPSSMTSDGKIAAGSCNFPVAACDFTSLVTDFGIDKMFAQMGLTCNFDKLSMPLPASMSGLTCDAFATMIKAMAAGGNTGGNTGASTGISTGTSTGTGSNGGMPDCTTNEAKECVRRCKPCVTSTDGSGTDTDGGSCMTCMTCSQYGMCVATDTSNGRCETTQAKECVARCGPCVPTFLGGPCQVDDKTCKDSNGAACEPGCESCGSLVGCFKKGQTPPEVFCKTDVYLKEKTEMIITGCVVPDDYLKYSDMVRGSCGFTREACDNPDLKEYWGERFTSAGITGCTIDAIMKPLVPLEQSIYGSCENAETVRKGGKLTDDMLPDYSVTCKTSAATECVRRCKSCLKSSKWNGEFDLNGTDADGGSCTTCNVCLQHATCVMLDTSDGRCETKQGKDCKKKCTSCADKAIGGECSGKECVDGNNVPCISAGCETTCVDYVGCMVAGSDKSSGTGSDKSNPSGAEAFVTIGLAVLAFLRF